MNYRDDGLERIAQSIAGEIILSDEPGKVMKKWRELFQISQKNLAQFLNISPSVISDYESGRRSSPRVETVKKFVEALIEMDERRGGYVTGALKKLMSPEIPSDVILAIREFPYPVNAKEFANYLVCKVYACEDILEKEVIYGYTAVDSVNAITKLSPPQLLRLYGATPRRAAIFTRVSTGRSPMTAIRVAQMTGGKALKPAIVILHGLEKIDPLAIKIAEIERVPLLVSRIESVEELVKKLRSFTP